MAPLRTALEFGGDEGYELMKAFLVSLGHPLYGEVWNDQSPLHTELLALVFRVFGPSAYAARLLIVGFTMVLVGPFCNVVSHRSGRVAGLMAVVLLASPSFFLQLSVSVRSSFREWLCAGVGVGMIELSGGLGGAGWCSQACCLAAR